MIVNKAAIQALESRCLLSLSALGPEMLVDTNDPIAIDVAVAPKSSPVTAVDGSSIVVNVYPAADATALVAHRYNADGHKVDQRIIASAAHSSLAVAMNRDGDAFIAYNSFE